MKINLLIVLTLLCSFGYSQTSNNTKDKETKWEIGLDILPLIRDTSYHMKEAIFIKHKLNEQTKLRGRFGIYFDDVKNEDTHQPASDTVFGHRPRIYFSVGIEKRIFTASKVDVNAGLDAFLFYKRRKTRQHIKPFNTNPPVDIERFVDDIEVKTGINVFVNAEYKFSPHFAINLESFWQFAYRRERYFNEEYFFGNLAQYGGNTINRFVTQLQPISSINLIYKF
jgi:hypothetical protein